MTHDDILEGHGLGSMPLDESSSRAIALVPDPDDPIACALHGLFEQTATYMGEEELAQLRSAFDFANSAHVGQVRKSGEPFINHPVQVALILAELRMDVDTVTAALLHDTVEDSSASLADVEEGFSTDVMTLVDGVTKITRIEIESLSEQQAKNIRKMLLAMSRDI
ncbi:MAG: HD domain-containing protein, partial [Coriobacteriales bacterium]|nr:HD domain-containing protein [Coriobacteriales bacterium]